MTYLLGESDSGFLGGDLNLRGPVWMPADYMLVEFVGRSSVRADGSRSSAQPDHASDAHNEVADKVHLGSPPLYA